MSDSFINPEQFGTLFQSGSFEEIYRCMSSDFQEFLPLEEFITVASSFNEGVQSYQVEFKKAFQSLDQYIWVDDQKERGIAVSFNQSNQIQGLLIKPYITYPDTDNQLTKNAYSMPISGEWFVFWGGTNEFINYHYAYEHMRYAYDLVKVQDGMSFKGDPTQIENFYAFNEEISAPADGKVINLIDGLVDHTPGEMDAVNAAGNYVVIEHANKEYSLLAHLKKNSIQVEIGELVKEGQCIGMCGNSGNTSEPHLHFQVMDSPDLNNAKSLRIRFKDGVEPIQGDTISNTLRG
ncbi:M23 family metallopeptidase [Solibacillus sp. FSL K6-1523]|uniref:M23 family metallopeptidase n=1 Tax=Solibacillus sp. FSL K6-1523 TaxID=2921471 RepID=UPI0030FC175E